MMRYLLVMIPLVVLPAAADAANTVTINYNSIGCQDPENLSRSIEIGQSGDEEAYVKFLTPLVESGECAMLKAGDKVFLEDVALFSGTACVRPRGETNCFTVEYEAIQDKSKATETPSSTSDEDESLLHKLLK